MERWLLIIGVVVIILGYLGWALFRPMPAIAPTTTYLPSQPRLPKAEVAFAGYGSQIVRVGDNGLQLSNSNNDIRPIASTAKLMLAQMILVQHPLKLGEQGTQISFDANDAALFNRLLSEGQSTIPIGAGMQLTQYQALQALLISSANNIASKLAIWGFGSEENYLTLANNYAKSIGMQSTNFADASGYLPKTASTAADMLKLSAEAIKNDVIKDIVSQKKATLPYAGEINNTNTSLGLSGITGIKTGHTNEAGGCLVYSASNNTVEIIGNVFGAPSKEIALGDVPKLIDAINANIKTEVVVHKGQPIAYYKIPWQGNVNVLASTDISLPVWAGEVPKTNTSVGSLVNGTFVGGNISSSSTIQRQASSNLVLAQQIIKPGVSWRLTHPL